MTPIAVANASLNSTMRVRPQASPAMSFLNSTSAVLGSHFFDYSRHAMRELQSTPATASEPGQNSCELPPAPAGLALLRLRSPFNA